MANKEAKIIILAIRSIASRETDHTGVTLKDIVTICDAFLGQEKEGNFFQTEAIPRNMFK